MPGFMGNICRAFSHKGKSWGKKGCLTIPIQQVWITSQLSAESTVQYRTSGEVKPQQTAFHRTAHLPYTHSWPPHVLPPSSPLSPTSCMPQLTSPQLYTLTPYPHLLHCSSSTTHHTGGRTGGQPLFHALFPSSHIPLPRQQLPQAADVCKSGHAGAQPNLPCKVKRGNHQCTLLMAVGRAALPPAGIQLHFFLLCRTLIQWAEKHQLKTHSR